MRHKDACISPDVRFCFFTDHFHIFNCRVNPIAPVEASLKGILTRFYMVYFTLLMLPVSVPMHKNNAFSISQILEKCPNHRFWPSYQIFKVWCSCILWPFRSILWSKSPILQNYKIFKVWCSCILCTLWSQFFVR